LKLWLEIYSQLRVASLWRYHRKSGSE